MTTQTLIPWLTSQFFSANGQPLAGGQLFTYAAGTNTPAPTYTDSTGLTPNANPVIANSRGEMSVWIPANTAYKFVLQDAAGNTIWTRDQVVNAQLITYYGVDTGAANAYIVTAATPYTAYANGELVFFVGGNTNTGPSTININGLGPIPIVTLTGAPLGAGQIVAGIMSELIYFNGAFQLLSIGNTFGVTNGTFGAEIPLQAAATVDLGSTPNHNVSINGTAAITSFGSSAFVQAPIYIIRFTGASVLAYNAVSMQLPGNTNITTTAGDSALVEYLGNGNWKILGYFFQTGASSGVNAKIKPGDTSVVSDGTVNPDPDLQSNLLGIGRYSWEAFLIFDSVAAAAGFKWTNGGTAVDSRGLAPALAYGFVNGAAYGPKSETPYGATVSYATVGTGANSNEVLYKGSLLVSTVGTFGISWSQAVSTASATTLRAGSYLTVNLLNTGTSAGSTTHIYTTVGSFTETIPTGYTTLTIEVWGGSGGGGARFISGSDAGGGGGGGSGGYARTSISVAGLGGDTVNFTVGAAGVAASINGGPSSVSSGGASPLPGLATMTANGGITGGAASGLFAPGAGSAGGSASGGSVVNTSGNSGAAGRPSDGGGTGSGGQGGLGGFGIAGLFSGGAGGGHGAGLLSFPSGTNGGTGIVVFEYQ